MTDESRWPLREALLPLVGMAGYRQVLDMVFSPAVLRGAGAPPAVLRSVAARRSALDVTALPHTEVVLESDSKSRIYVVHYRSEDGQRCSLVVKWYAGKRQPLAAVEQRMSAYFRRCLGSRSTVAPVLTVVPLPAAEPLSVAILPYLGNTTLYDQLHRVPPHTPEMAALLHQAGDTLAWCQVLGRMGHERGDIRLASLASEETTAYFLGQIDSVLLGTFAAAGQPLPMGDALLEQLACFAELLAADSRRAGLYYRGSNPRNIMWIAGQQVEIDFEQHTLRSRFIDIVTLLENGLEMTSWDDRVDYPCFESRRSFPAWQAQRRRAYETLERYNYLTHEQIETLTAAFVESTIRLERQYLAPERPLYTPAEQRMLLETTRLFRHLQYVGYCKRNEQQAMTAGKRLSSRYRQRLHALWAKCALDELLFPRHRGEACLPAGCRPAAMALRRTLDQLPLSC